MVRHGSEAAGQVWPLTGAWRAWFWLSAVILAVFLVGGLGIAVAAIVVALAGVPSGLILLLPAAILLAVGTIMGWQLRHVATTVSVGEDGSFVIQRPMGELRAHAGDVQRVRRSAFVSRPHTPTVIETPHGWAYLVRARREKEAVVGAIRSFNPSLHVEI